MVDVRSRCAVWAACTLALACGRTARDPRETDAAEAPDPELAAAPNCAVAIAGQGSRHCGVYQDGSMWCWGEQGVTLSLDEPPAPPPSHEPVRVLGVKDARQVVLGPRNGCALTQDGVYCWGANDAGQIDDSGRDVAVATRTELSLGDAVITDVGIDDDHICVVDAGSHVFCRGEHEAPSQVDVAGGPSTTMPGPGTSVLDDVGRIFSLKVPRHPKQLRRWGANNQALGSGTEYVLKRSGSVWRADAASMEAFAVVGLGESALQLGSGNDFFCALDTLGQVWCEGRNDRGQTGAETHTPARSGQVASLRDARAISVGGASACALLTDGTVWCWGSYSSTQATLAPTQVSACRGQLRTPNVPRLADANASQRLAEAGRARAQAMCQNARIDAAGLPDCIAAEDRSPNPICQDAVGTLTDEAARCWADQYWSEALCYAETASPGVGQVANCADKGASCERSKPNSRYCSQARCRIADTSLKTSQLCDGVLDCEDGTDERNCERTGQFECEDGNGTVMVSQQCDENVDCTDGSDERYCF